MIGYRDSCRTLMANLLHRNMAATLPYLHESMGLKDVADISSRKYWQFSQ